VAFHGHGREIVFDQNAPMGASTCIACGECVQACSTGALMPATLVDGQGVGISDSLREADSVCPFCGVGCQLNCRVSAGGPESGYRYGCRESSPGPFFRATLLIPHKDRAEHETGKPLVDSFLPGFCRRNHF
jgi:ferredoxin